jgi:hypothetical protein
MTGPGACLFHLQSPPGEHWLSIRCAIANPTDVASYDATIVKIDMEVYKGRHLIEHVLGKLKGVTRIASHSEKTDTGFVSPHSSQLQMNFNRP